MMPTSKGKSVFVALAGALATIISCTTAEAGSAPALDVARGGTLCLEIGGQLEGHVQHLKLQLDPANAPGPFNVIAIHGVERGSCNGEDYENAFVGTATEAPYANAKTPGAALHLFLTGGGTNVKGDGSTVLWVQHYAIELDRETLAGTLTGYDTGSSGVVDGKPYGSEMSNFIQRNLAPIDCSRF